MLVKYEKNMTRMRNMATFISRRQESKLVVEKGHGIMAMRRINHEYSVIRERQVIIRMERNR